MRSHLITGGAGFIGFNLARTLLDQGERVVAFDDLSRGREEDIAPLRARENFVFKAVDCADTSAMIEALKTEDLQVSDVWHLAANSDIPAGIAEPSVDLHRTFLTTFATLEAMRALGLSRLHFASSSAIYGDHGDCLIEEDIGPLQPISNYGAMKLASEALIRAAVESWLDRADVFRFPNVIGVPATHGVMLDFCRRLKTAPGWLDVLGDGTQQKAYLHVFDLINAMLHIASQPGRFNVYNIGPQDDGVTVRFIAETIVALAAPSADIRFGEGNRGWVGDVPRFRYSVDRLKAIGWTPRLGSRAAVERAAKEIVQQEVLA